MVFNCHFGKDLTMISKALKVLVSELNNYIESIDVEADSIAVLGNVAMLDNDGANGNTLSEKIILSLVNIEEEKRLKNRRNYVTQGEQIAYVNPPVNINLYLLFCANFNLYSTALTRLSQVIEFFQGKYVFSMENSPIPEFLNDPEMKDFKLMLDIHTLNFEQINDLWGSLGGKQLPFVMYRTRLLIMRRELLLSTAPPIEQIKGITNE